MAGAIDGDGAAISPTAYAVLGLLSFGRDLSGYDLKKWADSSLRLFYFRPATSQIYAELKRLERAGYVSSREEPQDELRNKRVYRITASGRAALTRWIEDAPVEPPVLKHSPVLRVWLGHLAGSDRLRALVEEHRALMEEMLAEARRSVVGAGADPRWRYPQLVARWAERYYTAERDAATALLEDLDQLAGELATEERQKVDR
jgi:DNA-binding PadR family transcriptional regulator